MNKLLPLILILFAAPCFGESYLCIADDAVGFIKDQNYSSTKFKLAKWVVKKTDDNEYQVNIHNG